MYSCGAKWATTCSRSKSNLWSYRVVLYWSISWEDWNILQGCNDFQSKWSDGLWWKSLQHHRMFQPSHDFQSVIESPQSWVIPLSFHVIKKLVSFNKETTSLQAKCCCMCHLLLHQQQDPSEIGFFIHFLRTSKGYIQHASLRQTIHENLVCHPVKEILLAMLLSDWSSSSLRVMILSMCPHSQEYELLYY